MNTKQHKLEILLAWLEDNAICETDIEFAEGVDSEAMIPVVRGAVALLKMPKAKRFEGYFYTEANSSLEMNRAEGQIWNEARSYAISCLNGQPNNKSN